MKVGAKGAVLKELAVFDAGFTIVETIIVLAVMAGLFLIIATTFSGRQGEAEFMHSIQVAQAQIQQTIDQVQNGYYPNNGNFTCTGSAGGLVFSTVSNSQGTNDTCIFLGKVIQFRVAGTGVSSPEQYRTYTIAGYNTSYSGAGSPFQPVKPDVVGVSGNYTNYSAVNTMEYGLTTLWVKYNNVTNIGSFGVLMEPGTAGSGPSKYVNGGQQIDLVPISGSATGQTIPNAVSSIRSALQSAALVINPPGGVEVCLVSGSTNQSGLITIGNNGRQLAVKLDIRGNQTCS